MRWLLILALATSVLAGCGWAQIGGGDGTGRRHGEEQRLRPSNQLTICVDALGDVENVELEAVRTVDTILKTKVAEHEFWDQGFPQFRPPEIDAGCPFDPDVGGTGRRVDNPSYHSEAVFIVSQDEMDRIEWAPGWLMTSEEFTCSGDACGEVTGGLYLSPDALSDPPFLTDMLEKAIGLERPDDPIEPGYHGPY